MKTRRDPQSKRYFTAAEANAALPLVRAIVQDVTELASALQDRYERLQRLGSPNGTRRTEAHQEEVRQIQEEFARDQERMKEYEREILALGAVLKDYHVGLVDFPSRIQGREAYLCWRLGEPAVAHWHELESGFAGRRPLGESLPVESGRDKDHS